MAMRMSGNAAKHALRLMFKLPVILAVDTSSPNVYAVQDALPYFIEQLEKCNSRMGGVQVTLTVVTFNNGTCYTLLDKADLPSPLTDKLILTEVGQSGTPGVWNTLQACVNSCNVVEKTWSPTVILMSDSDIPGDFTECRGHGIALGDGANVRMLKDFSKGADSFYKVTPENTIRDYFTKIILMLRNRVPFVSINGSKIIQRETLYTKAETDGFYDDSFTGTSRYAFWVENLEDLRQLEYAGLIELSTFDGILRFTKRDDNLLQQIEDACPKWKRGSMAITAGDESVHKRVIASKVFEEIQAVCKSNNLGAAPHLYANAIIFGVVYGDTAAEQPAKAIAYSIQNKDINGVRDAARALYEALNKIVPDYLK